jgi:glycosyltransferase involved in cell wall biosynthesis
MHSLVFGTPAITHNSFEWQMPEFEAIKEGKTGAFFERGNVESLAVAIQRWFDSQNDREQTRRECFQEIDENWTPEYQIKMLKNHIELK